MALQKPTIYDIQTDYARFGLTATQRDTILSKRFENRDGGDERAIVYHIQDGFTIGSLEYWLPRQASSTVMIQRDGSILKVIPEQHGPWTNGDVQNPSKEAQPLLDLGGNPNVWSLTIEAEGHPFDVMPQVETDAIAWQTLDWMDRYPKITLDWIFRHGWINSVTRINCGLYINDVKAIVLRELGTVPPNTKYPNGMDEGIASQLFGKVTGDPGGKTYSFNPDGTISNLWLEYGKQTGHWPKLRQVKVYDTRIYFTFEGGYTLWRAGTTGPFSVLK